MASLSRSGGRGLAARRLWSLYTGRSPIASTTRHLSGGAALIETPTSLSRRSIGSCHQIGHPCSRPLFRRHLAMAPWSGLRAAEELRKELESQKEKKSGDAVEEEEDYMGVAQRITKLERHIALLGGQADQYVEPSDSEGEDDDRFWPGELRKRDRAFNRRCQEHEELLKKFATSETLDDAVKLMDKIEDFEQKHFNLPPEYRVIGDMMNCLKEASGKERFILLQKLNRAVRLAERRQANDPDNPANYGAFSQKKASQAAGRDTAASAKRLQVASTGADEGDEDDSNERKEHDDVLLEKLNAIDTKLEEKLAIVDQTFGKKGKALQEEIKELAQERYALTAEKRTSLRRKGFDVKLIYRYRTSKVTKGGRVFKTKVILACGNYDGVVGFAKGKGENINEAFEMAHEKCFENLHYVERHEEHTIAHAIQAKYGKTKIYLWPARTATGVVAGDTVKTILLLAGYKNVKSKVIGSRNPYNTVKAVFQALNSIETPKDVQEKFGRAVVESYLL